MVVGVLAVIQLELTLTDFTLLMAHRCDMLKSRSPMTGKVHFNVSKLRPLLRTFC